MTRRKKGGLTLVPRLYERLLNLTAAAQTASFMATSAYFPKNSRQNGHHRARLSISNALPVYASSSSSSAVQEKYATRAQQFPWLIRASVRVPGLPLPRIRIYFINPRRLHHFSTTRFGRKRGSLFLCISISVLIFFVFALAKRFGTHAKRWPTPFPRDPPTLVYRRDDLQLIWQWELASGHYPSRQTGMFLSYFMWNIFTNCRVQCPNSCASRMSPRILPYHRDERPRLHILRDATRQTQKAPAQSASTWTFRARQRTLHIRRGLCQVAWQTWTL